MRSKKLKLIFFQINYSYIIFYLIIMKINYNVTINTIHQTQLIKFGLIRESKVHLK